MCEGLRMNIIKKGKGGFMSGLDFPQLGGFFYEEALFEGLLFELNGSFFCFFFTSCSRLGLGIEWDVKSNKKKIQKQVL